jgi:adenosine deaminase
MLPVAELHVHIEGTLEPELLVKLAARNGAWMPTLDVDELRAGYRFDGLSSFLRLYYANLRVLKSEADFYDLASAVGLDSAEVGYPPALFTEVYRRAAAEGLRLVAHAGEEGGPEYVREALDELHVERVDHGVRTMEDPELVARLRAEQIPLTVCPLSNVALRVVGTLGDHMLPGMLEAGLLATVNSDDPAYFGGYVDDNLAALRGAFGYDDARLAALARNSFDACFAPEADKQQWKAEVDGWLVPRAAAPGQHRAPG